MDTNMMSSAAAFVDEAIYGARPDAPWPNPDMTLIREEGIAAPAFPVNVLPPAWARWTAEAAEGAGAPQPFVAVALLAAAGAIIGNARWSSPWDPWKEPPAVNVALIGRPSSGKSPALDQVQELITLLDAESNADWAERLREHQRAVLEAKEHMKAYETEVKMAVDFGAPAPEMPPRCVAPKPVERRRLCTTDVTIEKAARLSEANPRGLMVVRDELAGWLSSMDRYASGAGGDRPFWLQAYGGRSWALDRVKDSDPVLIPHLLWSIVGTIQPDRVATLMMAGDDDGLTARMLYCWPDRVPPRRPSCRADTSAALDRLRRLRGISWEDEPEPKILPFTKAAADAFQEWRKQVAEMESEAAGLMLSWLGKLPGMAVRLALILELLAWSESGDGTPEPQTVCQHSVIAAITFLYEFALPMARRTFGAAALPEPERDARRLARWLLQQRPMPKTVNAKSLRRMARGPAISDSKRMDAALVELEAAGWVRAAFSRTSGHGRQRKDYAVNPALAEEASV